MHVLTMRRAAREALRKSAPFFARRPCSTARHAGAYESKASIRNSLLKTTALIAVATVLISAASGAKADTWIGAGVGGAWIDSTQWSSGRVPNGVDAVATFVAVTPGLAAGLTLVGGPFTVGTLNLNASVPSSGFMFQNGTLIMQSTTGSAAINVQSSNLAPDIINRLQLDSNTVITTETASATFTVGWVGTITGTGSITVAGPGTVNFETGNSYTGGTIVNGGALLLSGSGTLGGVTNTLTVNGGTLDLGGTAQSQMGGVAQTGGTIRNGSLWTTAYKMAGGTLASTVTLNGSISFELQAGTVSGVLLGAGGLSKTTSGIVTLAGANSYSGGTTVSAGTLTLSGAATLGNTANRLVVNGGTIDLGGTTQTQAAVSLAGGVIENGSFNSPIASAGGTIDGLGGTASLTTAAGTTVLKGTNTYTGATVVNGGVLDVEGTITGTSAVTVNAGGTLTGTGIIDPPTVTINNGATFAPGNGSAGSSINIAGSLALASGAIYRVQIDPRTATFATVAGTAALGGATVNAVFANGNYVRKTYTILTASGGVTGAFASDAVTTNLPANFKTRLSYDANNAYFDLSLDFGGSLSRNQQAVANTLGNYFNRNGGAPSTYATLNAAGLSQASGELAVGAQQITFEAMNQFMGMLTDPAMTHNADAGRAGAAASFANEDSTATKRTDAFTTYVKSPAPTSFEQRWSVWASGFGGSQTTQGDAIVGSSNTTSRIFGTAVGADRLIAPMTIAGFALGGGGTNFSVANSGTGRSDLFQAGAYLRHANGAAYFSAAIAYGWQDVSTDRTVTAVGADRLRAGFNANAWSGRIEGGYRFVAPWSGGIGITPYAAAQVATLGLPAYAEQVVSGASTFALSYDAKWSSDARTELGLRTDKSMILQDGVLTLRSRLAWAHDTNSDRSIVADFQALPGANFVVSGAAPAADAALTAASAEVTWAGGWSATATFDGSFSQATRSYAGRGVIRYQW